MTNRNIILLKLIKCIILILKNIKRSKYSNTSMQCVFDRTKTLDCKTYVRHAREDEWPTQIRKFINGSTTFFLDPMQMSVKDSLYALETSMWCVFKLIPALVRMHRLSTRTRPSYQKNKNHEQKSCLHRLRCNFSLSNYKLIK